MKALNILISSCSRPEAYDLLFLLGRGKVFGERQPISITLYDEHSQNSKLTILASEVRDCASVVLQEVYVEDDPEKLFRDIDFAIMLDTIETTNSINVIIWGNSLPNFLVDISHAEFQSESGLYKSAIKQINNEHWRKYILQPYVKNKCSDVSPDSEVAICKAKAIANHIKDLWFGTSINWSSMIVHSNGEYDIPKNIFFGFPVSIRKPHNPPEIVHNLKFYDWEEAQFIQRIHEIDEHSKTLHRICESKELEEKPCPVSTLHN
nr:cytosolic malate dehydrogenase [Hymenolepis microstoma]